MEAPAQQPPMRRAVAGLTFINFFNLILSFASAIVVAGFFGTGSDYDAYILAWMIPELLVFVVNNLSLATVMPVFLERETQAGKQTAWREAWRALSAIMLLGLLVAVVMVMLASPVLNLSGTDESRTQLVLQLMPWMACSFWFSLLHRQLSGLHFVHRSYYITHISAVMPPLGMIAGAMIAAPNHGVLALGWGMAAGALMQSLMLLPAVLRWGGKYFSLKPGGQSLAHMATLSLPLLVFALADRAIVVIDRSFASGLSSGAISALKYAQQLILAATALVSVPVVRVLMTETAKAAAADDKELFDSVFKRGLEGAGVLVLGVMGLMVALAQPLIATLFQRGAFDANSTTLVSNALFLYSFSLPGITAISLLQAANISYKKPGALSFAGGIAVVLTIMLDYFLVRLWDYQGIALANALVAIIWAGLLLYLSRRLVGKAWLEATPSLIKALIAATLMSVSIWYVSSVWTFAEGWLMWLRLGALGLLGCVLYAGLLHISGQKMIAQVVNTVWRRLHE